MDKSRNTLDANEALNKIQGAASETMNRIRSSDFAAGIKTDFEHVKSAAKNAHSIFTENADDFTKRHMSGIDSEVSALREAGAGDEALGALRKERMAAFETAKTDRSFARTGENLLEGLGRGNKIAGGAKLGAYMIGASMLTDLLNPFND